MSKRTLRWLLILASDVAAYGVVFWEGIWPLARYVAGWYVIIVTVAILVAGIVTLSVWWGPVRYRPGMDYFMLW